MLPRARALARISLWTSSRHFSWLGYRTEDNLNLDFIKIVICKVYNLVKSFLADVQLGLIKSLVLPLDHRTPHGSLPQAVALHAFLE